MTLRRAQGAPDVMGTRATDAGADTIRVTMGPATASGRPQSRRAPRRRRGARGKFALIALASAIVFVVGFLLLWSLGSIIVGGAGFPWTNHAEAAISPVALQAQVDHPLEPLVDLRGFRDLSYVPVKGIYVSSYWAGKPDLLQKMLTIADTTEINAFVVDVKDDLGKAVYNCDVPMARSLGLVDARIPDIDALIATLREHDITPIARLVCFNDNALANARPELAIKSSKGGLWKDSSGPNGRSYTDPYNHEVWDYLVQIAEDVAKHGFREIQFDYVRFPAQGPVKEAVYPDANGMSMADAITGFLAYARERLEPLGVWVSADLFGMTLRVTNDQGMGQILEQVARNVDIVCPMVYPSHYTDGFYGLDSPEKSPYELVTAALKDASRRMGGTGAMVRPWLQDFSLRVTYGVAEVKAQIKAAEEQGYTEWMLWDPGLNYTMGALRSQGGA
jgi:hypothetical protein